MAPTHFPTLEPELEPLLFSGAEHPRELVTGPRRASPRWQGTSPTVSRESPGTGPGAHQPGAVSQVRDASCVPGYFAWYSAKLPFPVGDLFSWIAGTVVYCSLVISAAGRSRPCGLVTYAILVGSPGTLIILELALVGDCSKCHLSCWLRSHCFGYSNMHVLQQQES